MKASRRAAALLLVAITCLCTRALAGPTQCSKQIPSKPLNVPLSKDTVAWGYFWRYREPVAYVKSGEEFTIEMATHQAGDYYEGMIKGDKAMEDIYKWEGPDANGMNILTRGRGGRADGKHIMTGPVYICGAEPGDTVEIQILDMKPRKNKDGRAFSSNGLTAWGFQNRAQASRRTDSTIIYELILDKDGYAMWAEPQFYFRWRDDAGNPLVEQPCFPLNGTIKANVAGKDIVWSNPAGTITGFNYTCENGKVKLGGYHYAGAIVDPEIPTMDRSIKGRYRLPVSPHIGNIGLASDVDDTTNSAWPMRTGGNIDQKRLGVGSKLFVPVEVEGGLLSAGDCHAGQTASEYSGTALETSFTAKLKVIVHKKDNKRVPALYKNLPTPFLENDNEWCWHGFTVNDYLHDNQTAPGWNQRLPPLATNTYQLMNNTAVVATDGLMRLGFTQDEAISILTFACDWEVTQVVNTNMGNNICCYKYILPPKDAKDRTAYVPTTFFGSSRPLKIRNNKVVKPYA